MKILVVCQHYWPEPFPITDICEGLASMGHTVHVITDVPNYPMGYIYEDYKGGKNRREERNGVKIFRTFTIGRRKNLIFRFLNYYSFAFSSKRFAKKLREDYDVVFAVQGSPIMMISGALAYAKKHKKKCVLYSMDLWPASLAAGGVGQGSPLYKYFHRVSRKLYTRCDRILITSRMFREYFRREFDIPDGSINYLPQYADALFSGEQPGKMPSEHINLVFAGNVGAAQSLSTVLRAAKLLEDEKNLRWHIVGDGSELENLKQMTQDLQLESVLFHGRRPLEEMPLYYSVADAMLATLTSDELISLTLPNKIQSYMASGKPIIAAANGEIPKVIAASGCGFCADAEDAEGLADAVRKFLNCPDREKLGRSARKYYETHFTRQTFMNKLQRELENACR